MGALDITARTTLALEREDAKMIGLGEVIGPLLSIARNI